MKFPLWFRKHKHDFEIHHTQDEMWLQCSCGKQEDIPEDREEEAYEKIRNRDFAWKTQPNSTTKS